MAVKPVNRKVKYATVASYLAGVGLLGVVEAFKGLNLVAEMPGTAEMFVAPLLVSLTTFLSGHVAKTQKKAQLPPS